MRMQISSGLFGLVLSLACVAGDISKTAAPLTDLELGRRIYREGILSNGQTLTAKGAGDVALSGKQLTCASCHRRSGFGTSEGSRRVPAITGKILAAPLTQTYREIRGGRKSGEGARPAYTESALIRAITQGFDVNGREMDPLMPHFMLNDTDLKLLLNYLNTLETENAPGITESDIHYATIFTPSTTASQKKIVLDTIKTFFDGYNAETRGEDRRAKHGPWSKAWQYGSFRHLQIHSWELTGPAEQWPEQLQKYYAQQPVYAVVNGVGLDNWQPVHDFCETREIPCLFPTTDVPGKSTKPYYSVYFSEGIALDARVAATFLQNNTKTASRILQIYRAEPRSEQAAQAFSTAVKPSKGTHLDELKLAQDQALTHELLQQHLASSQANTLVLWLAETDLPAVDKVIADTATIKTIVVARSFIAADTKFPTSMQPRTYVISPYVPDIDMVKHLIRYQSWAKMHHLETSEVRIGANAYFASMMSANAVRGLRANLAREHMLDQFEHMLERGLFFSVYPNFTLGPEQRYASKGCYVIGPMSAQDKKEGRYPKKWIVPDKF